MLSFGVLHAEHGLAKLSSQGQGQDTSTGEKNVMILAYRTSIINFQDETFCESLLPSAASKESGLLSAPRKLPAQALES